MKTIDPIIMGRLGKWFPLLWKHRAPDRPYIKRLCMILLTSALSFPVRMFEQVRFKSAIQRHPIHKAPVFIIGFWRSGTTYLHNCLCKDSQFGYLSLYKTLTPDFFLLTENLLKPVFQKFTPEHRPMDRVEMCMDSPQEEELALINITGHSLYYQMFFPKNPWYFFRKYSNLTSLPMKEYDKWRTNYMMLIKKLSYYFKGKRLILKNPSHLGRIKQLLDLFPDAKFIHIYRDPYRIYPSCFHMFQTLIPICQLQKVNWKEIMKYILFIYREMMEKYFSDRNIIPPENIIEIPFEKFEEDPLEYLYQIYKKFNIEYSEDVKCSLQRYIQSQKTFTKNEYCMNKNEIALINEHWKLIINKLGYTIRT